MVVLPILSTLTSGWPFGFASAPYDPEWALRYPGRAAWMALAGPAANFALVIAAILAIRVGVLAGIFYAPDSDLVAVSGDCVSGSPCSRGRSRGGKRLPAQCC